MVCKPSTELCPACPNGLQPKLKLGPDEKCVECKCPFVECTKKKADLAFILDSSGSIKRAGPDNWKLVLQFVESVVDKLDVGRDDVRISICSYANNTKINFDLDDFSDKTAVKNAIRRIPYIPDELGIRGYDELLKAWTNTAGAINTMRSEIFTPRRGDRANVE